MVCTEHPSMRSKRVRGISPKPCGSTGFLVSGQEKWQAANSEGLASLAAHRARVLPRAERLNHFTFHAQKAMPAKQVREG